MYLHALLADALFRQARMPHNTGWLGTICAGRWERLLPKDHVALMMQPPQYINSDFVLMCLEAAHIC